MESPRGHVIVCGLEHLGMRVVQELRALGQEVVVLAREPAATQVEHARGHGARVVEGSSQEEEDLRHAGAETAACVVLTEDGDLNNLHAAVTAQEIQPGIRVVARIFSPDLGRRASALVDNVSVLATAAISAPILAAEALNQRSGTSIEVWGRQVVLRDSAEEEAVLARLEDDLVLTDAGLAPAALIASAVRWRGRRKAMRALRAFFDRRLAVVLGLVFLLSIISIVVFAAFDHLSPVDAVYFTITTISTVGYGDINLATSANWLKLYDTGFMLFGATALAAFYALVTDAIVGARLSAALGLPHGNPRNHVVVCGLGNVGFRVVEHLVAQGIEVTACDVNERGRFVQVVRQLGVPVLGGDALMGDNLRIVGAARARAVIAATNDDVTNIEVAMAVREMNPGARMVARVFDEALGQRAESRFGIHACHSATALAAPYFTAAAMGDDVNCAFPARDRWWLLVERSVAASAPAAGMRVSDFEEQTGGYVVAVRDEAAENWRPERDKSLHPGQQILVATAVAGLDGLRQVTPS